MNDLDDHLLDEIERQKRYLARLPKNYRFPVMSGKHAIESQRHTGYKSTARAAREIVDNALEAGAKEIHVVLERVQEQDREKNKRRESVSAISFIDDGPGMIPGMLRFALTLGGGTHKHNPRGIGKFGFGLPNSSLNQTPRVEVYSRTAKKPWHCAVLDVSSVGEFEDVTIPPATPAELPAFVQEYVAAKRLRLTTGTAVVWVKPDRLTYTQAGALREHLIDDFAVVYRGVLDRFRIIVDGVTVEKVDPLFLTPGALYYVPPEEGGAIKTFERTFPLKLSVDPDSGSRHVEYLPNKEAVTAAKRDPGVRFGVMSVRIARFPYGFALGEKKYRGTDAYKRFEFRKPRRGISFVRAGREIDTMDAFPRSARDVARGLGDWPLLQSYAYHWGVEVSFGPELDDVFGVSHDKQTLRPIEDFWRVLASAELDKALRLEEREQRGARHAERVKRSAARRTDPNTPSPATQAAAEAAEAMGSEELPRSRRAEARARLRDEVQQRIEDSGRSEEDVLAAIRDESERKKYAIEFFQADGGVFYRPTFGNGYQQVVEINKAHPFFRLFYAQLLDSGNERALAVLDLLLIALTTAELASEGKVKDFYEFQREHRWSPFLNIGLKVLDRIEPALSDTEEQQEVE